MLRRAILSAVVLSSLGLSAAVIVRGQSPGSNERPYRAYVAGTAKDGAPGPVGTQAPPAALPAKPAGWPEAFALGQSDAPGGAVATKARGLTMRYQYLAGGVNTGSGWATWQPGGGFVTSYIEESMSADVLPVFTYYMVRQSQPGASRPEADGVEANLRSQQTMRALYDDLQLFFERANASGAPLVVLHFEPDMWGYIQQKSKRDDATTFSMPVHSSGHPDLGDLPDNAAGLAQAVLRLRDRYGPNTLVAYHMSTWGTGTDPLYTNPDEDEVEELASSSAAFYTSLGADFDLTFAEMSDRDAGFKQHIYGDGGASWWDAGDFARHASYLGIFVQRTGTRVVLWQVPQGNTVMRAQNNTWNHFQDNKVEWLLGDTGLSGLQPYVAAGVLAVLFGRGADGATCACDAAGDAVTNPAPINGNDRPSVSADDDGGYFEERVRDFAALPSIALP